MGTVRLKYVESEGLTHRWADSCTRAAESYLDEVVGPRSMFRIGQYDIVVGKKYGHLPFLLAAHDPTGTYVGTKEFDPNRLTMHSSVIETLWSFVNTGRKHPMHDELMSAIQHEVEGWGRAHG